MADGQDEHMQEMTTRLFETAIDLDCAALEYFTDNRETIEAQALSGHVPAVDLVLAVARHLKTLDEVHKAEISQIDSEYR